MAYADSIRTSTATMNAAATLIDGIGSSTSTLAWSSWTPTYSGSGSLTFGTVTTNYGKYIQLGKFVVFVLRATGTTGGTTNDAILFTPPVNAAAATTTGLAIGAGTVTDSTNGAGVCLRYTSVSSFAVYKESFGNYGLGASRVINVIGLYEAA
jgi:hypothetical protein